MARLFVLALLAIAMCGCAMCASPYDYCGPVVEHHPSYAARGVSYEEAYGEPFEGELIEPPPPLQSTRRR